jgi:hypothetical protein
MIQLCESELGFNLGDISGNVSLLKQFTFYLNLGVSEAWSVILPASGKWTLDDINQTDNPIVKTDLISGQRNYTFTDDSSGNAILEIFKVFVKDTSGVFHEIDAVDQNTETVTALTDGRNQSGMPTKYDLIANGISFDYVPDYSSTKGIMMLIDREATEFVTTDTTKKPGFAGQFHEYPVLSACYRYAAGPRQLPCKTDLLDRKTKMEKKMQEYYADRDRGNRKRMTPSVDSTR